MRATIGFQFQVGTEVIGTWGMIVLGNYITVCWITKNLEFSKVVLIWE